MSTLNVTNINAADGTSSLTIANGTGNIDGLTGTGTFLIDNNHPYFFAEAATVFQSAAYLGTPSAFTAAKTWNTVTLNQANLLNTTNGYMEVPSGQAGLYEVHVSSNSGTTNAHRSVDVYKKSGSTITHIDNVFCMNDYSGYRLASHKILNLLAGDIIMVGYHNSYDSWNTNITPAYSSFFARRIK
jgi:hypothetical protein